MKELIEEAGESEIQEEDSLSVNTSDADRIESEYYLDEAIDQKVKEVNQNFERRMGYMTKVVIDRIEEADKPAKSKTNKRKYRDSFDDDDNRGHKFKRSKQQENDDYLDKMIASGKYAAKRHKAITANKYYSMLNDKNDNSEILADIERMRRRRDQSRINREASSLFESSGALFGHHRPNGHPSNRHDFRGNLISVNKRVPMQNINEQSDSSSSDDDDDDDNE